MSLIIEFGKVGFWKGWKTGEPGVQFLESRKEERTNKRPIPSICHGEPGIRTRAATIGGMRVSLSEALSLLHVLPIKLGYIFLASVKKGKAIWRFGSLGQKTTTNKQKKG